MSEQNKFPKDFLWGAATSSHQVEGGNHNDWSEWEKQNAKRLAHAASQKQWPDYILRNYPSPLQEENYISGRACDHYHRFREDFDIARGLGHNAHRFSIEWSRIEPEEGKFDEKEIEHYRNVIKALKERGMEPLATLWHWTLPLWVRDMGGWENKKIMHYFIRYIEKVVNSYSDVRYWIPMNEPNIYIALGYLYGVQPPGKKSFLAAERAFKNLMKAYRQACDIIHNIDHDARVGVSHAAHSTFAYKNRFLNKLPSIIFDYLTNGRFLHAVMDKADFIGIQYYRAQYARLKIGGSRWGIAETVDIADFRSDLEWGIYPEGLYRFLKKTACYGKPIHITENGIADARDIHREKFIREHLFWMQKAMREGADVRGYFYWSLLDNFEMPRIDGFWPRFGLVEVDYRTQERKIRPSARAYQEIIERGVIST